METERYSLWLALDSKTEIQLKPLMAQFSKRLSTPVFEPHITLVSGLQDTKEQLIQKSEALASNFRPFNVTFENVDVGVHYFQCLYINIELDLEMKHVREKAEERFKTKWPYPFNPHISLVYGELDELQKLKLKQESERALVSTNCEITSLMLTDTSGYPGEWHIIKKLPLGI